VSLGFDTASKTYAEMIGNIGRDALSAKKYYHFIKLMGRSASHIALECALKTEPNLTLIGEEIEKNKQTISEITKQIADLIIKRASKDKHYGLILIPEGLIEFIPEMKCLIKELNELLSAEEFDQKSIKEKLSKSSLTTFESLPSSIQKQLLLERDPHGNVQVAKIQTEELFLETVSAVLSKKGIKFHATSHSFGYEGRAGFPSNFDADYCYSLGILATLLVKSGVTSYMCSIQGLAKPASKWNLLGLPLVSLLNFEMRKGKKTPVIQKNLVDLEGKPFQSFADQREKWSLGDQYLCPGPIQFFGSEAITDSRSVTLLLESE
ncbi:MAG: diphosphate--fructose-6-phosphate 1-phosphotransferase, partial [Simkaniaceae bacterium]|nr:diphosphate--fructose-6-phosphate 1-phosphotransferase [Simkaniaceae bacterium]